MADDLHNRGPQDRSRINVHEPWELNWGTKEPGVSEERLRALVAQHGVSAAKIRQILGK
jgi:hypothetical protein